MEKLNINQWAAEDRPREKMMQKGAEALSDAELLAILIGSGNTEETAVTLMQRILAACGNDLNRLGKWEVRDFSRFKGMGPAKSITVMASLELGKRRKLQERSGRTAIRSSADIYELFHPLHCLPVRRNMIVTDDVIESPQSIVIPEAANREISATVVLKRLLESL
jgi:DNA repair protein RadC